MKILKSLKYIVLTIVVVLAVPSLVFIGWYCGWLLPNYFVGSKIINNDRIINENFKNKIATEIKNFQKEKEKEKRRIQSITDNSNTRDQLVDSIKEILDKNPTFFDSYYTKYRNQWIIILLIRSLIVVVFLFSLYQGFNII